MLGVRAAAADNTGMNRLRWLPALLSLLALACLRLRAAARPYTPPRGKVWTGVTAGFDVGDYTARTGKHPAIWQHFIAWGGSYQYTLENSRRAGARLMLHLSTARGQNMPERSARADRARGRPLPRRADARPRGRRRAGLHALWAR